MESGFWPTQHTEIADALFRNVQSHQESTTTGPKKPKIALLTQTVVPSPVIQFVLPARLRSRLQNDVVFVGERSLVLREIVMGSYLEDVSVNSDFDADIMAVKAIYLYGDMPLDIQMRLGIQEDSSGPAYTGKDLPDHLLVLTLDSKELVFLYYRDDDEKRNGRFTHFRRPLPSDVSIVERFGRHLAVDPKSRAVAVAAPANFFGVFLLRSPEDLLSQVKKESLDPIFEERFFRLDGDILFMEFLYPEAENENKIILLFIISKGSDTLAVSYVWDSADTLRQARPKVISTKLPGVCRLPSLVIPLTKSTSFMIVTTSLLILASHCTSPDMRFTRQPISEIDTSLPMTWAKWTRPYRHQKYNKSHDDIYLCREDGVIIYVNISNNGSINGVHVLGSLDCDVDRAFDTIDFSDPSHGGDLLIAAGNTGNGGLFISEPRQSPTCVQKFENWAPILDTVLVPPSEESAQHEQSMKAHTNGNGRLYGCSSSANGRGAINEFRYGYEAQIGWIVSLEDLSSARSIWCIPDFSDEGTYLLVSDPLTSTLLYLSRSNGGEIYAVDDLNSALDTSAQTLAAGYTTEGVLVQVTSNSVCLAVPENPSLNHVSSFQIDQNVLISAVNGRLALFAVVIRSDHGIALKVGKIKLFEGCLGSAFLGDIVDLNEVPTSLLIEEINNEIFIFIGLGEGHIDCYQLLGLETHYIGRYTLELSDGDLLKVIDSMVFLTWPGRHHAALFCGLRSGVLVPIDIQFNMESSKKTMKTTQHPYIKLGHTVVKVSKKDKSVLTTCGSGFWCISNFETTDASNFDLNEVWITDQDNSAYVQKSVEVFTVVDAPGNSSSTTLDGSLVCISEGQLLICSLDRRAKAIPRKIEMPGGANRIAYSQYLQSLIVAYTATETVKITGTGNSKLYTRPYLDFIDLETHQSSLSPSQQGSQDKGAPKLWRPSGSSGEKITCILDWIPEHDGQKYHFIVIGTARRSREEKGRIIFLHTRRNTADPGQIECSVKYIHPFDGPVRAVAAYGECTLMVAAGNDIVPIEPDIPKRKKQWVPSARFKLTSPGVSITVHDTFLYVSTARESLVVLKVVENKLELYAHDGARLESLSHYHIGGESKLVLASTRGGKLSLFSETGITNTDKLLTPAVAEANIPLSVIRLSPCPAHPLLPASTVTHGVTADGTIYRITTINEKEWQLLRFVQNLCSRDSLVSPFLSARKRRWTWTDIMPQSNKPSQMHVDGDILSRLVKHGADRLRDILDGNATRSLQVDASAAFPLRTCMEIFEEMAREVFGEITLHDNNTISYFMRWLQKLLQPRI
ncbi:Autophagy-related protein 2 [Talaromyces islandicus]|uniref:Autophagy-related protein 2 n=1 Tax=Talaromyces islandicus TaxID=28573 RepID=A0A0U1M3Z3_TALIS|nr:Autophagy-related protein 2 [Talaromyces islandicus]